MIEVRISTLPTTPPRVELQFIDEGTGESAFRFPETDFKDRMVLATRFREAADWLHKREMEATRA